MLEPHSTVEVVVREHKTSQCASARPPWLRHHMQLQYSLLGLAGQIERLFRKKHSYWEANALSAEAIYEAIFLVAVLGVAAQ